MLLRLGEAVFFLKPPPIQQNSPLPVERQHAPRRLAHRMALVDFSGNFPLQVTNRKLFHHIVLRPRKYGGVAERVRPAFNSFQLQIFGENSNLKFLGIGSLPVQMGVMNALKGKRDIVLRDVRIAGPLTKFRRRPEASQLPERDLRPRPFPPETPQQKDARRRHPNQSNHSHLSHRSLHAP